MNPCIVAETIKKNMVQEQKLLTIEKKKCDDLTYSVIHKYMKDETLKSLLESIIEHR